MSDGNDLSPRGNFFVDIVVVESAIGIEINVFEFGALGLSDALPWDEVAVMFADRQNDLIAFVDVGQAVGVGDEIKRLGRVFGKNDLGGRRRVDEFGDARASGLIDVGGAD